MRWFWIRVLAFFHADDAAVCEASAGLYGTLDYHTPADAVYDQIMAAGDTRDGWWTCRRCGKTFYS